MNLCSCKRIFMQLKCGNNSMIAWTNHRCHETRFPGLEVCQNATKSVAPDLDIPWSKDLAQHGWPNYLIKRRNTLLILIFRPSRFYCAHLPSLDRNLLSISVCPSVRLSVKRVHPDKTKYSYVNTSTPYYRALFLVSWAQISWSSV